MTAAEWILAGGEVLADGQEDETLPLVQLMPTLNAMGVQAVLEALRDATDAAVDHLADRAAFDGDSDDEWRATVRSLEGVRLAMRNALSSLKDVQS